MAWTNASAEKIETGLIRSVIIVVRNESHEKVVDFYPARKKNSRLDPKRMVKNMHFVFEVAGYMEDGKILDFEILLVLDFRELSNSRKNETDCSRDGENIHPKKLNFGLALIKWTR